MNDVLVEDRALLGRFRAAEPEALRKVFRHYAPMIAVFLRRGFSFRTKSGSVRFAGYRSTFDLEDVLQETFRRAFAEGARMRYDGLRPYRTYLLTIARNAVVDEYQTRSKALEHLGFTVSEHSVQEDEWSVADDPLDKSAAALTPTGNPERDMQVGELRAAVSHFRATLSGREAAVFDLRFGHGLAQRQISQQTGLSPSKVKTAEARIRKGLLKLLRQRGFLTDPAWAPVRKGRAGGIHADTTQPARKRRAHAP